MLLIFKSGKRGGILSLSLCFSKHTCFVLSAFIHRIPCKKDFDFFINYFKQVFYVIIQRRKLIGLSIFVAYCRSFTKIIKRGGASIDPCGTPHLIVCKEVFSSS